METIGAVDSPLKIVRTGGVLVLVIVEPTNFRENVKLDTEFIRD